MLEERQCLLGRNEQGRGEIGVGLAEALLGAELFVLPCNEQDCHDCSFELECPMGLENGAEFLLQCSNCDFLRQVLFLVELWGRSLLGKHLLRNDSNRIEVGELKDFTSLRHRVATK